MSKLGVHFENIIVWYNLIIKTIPQAYFLKHKLKEDIIFSALFLIFYIHNSYFWGWVGGGALVIILYGIFVLFSGTIC